MELNLIRMDKIFNSFLSYLINILGVCMTLDSIGARIRNIRGLESRKSFADKFGIGTATLQRYEDNERTPDVEFLVKIQRYAEVTLDYLVNGEDFSLSIEEKNLLNIIILSNENDLEMIKKQNREIALEFALESNLEKINHIIENV